MATGVRLLQGAEDQAFCCGMIAPAPRLTAGPPSPHLLPWLQVPLCIPPQALARRPADRPAGHAGEGRRDGEGCMACTVVNWLAAMLLRLAAAGMAAPVCLALPCHVCVRSATACHANHFQRNAAAQQHAGLCPRLSHPSLHIPCRALACRPRRRQATGWRQPTVWPPRCGSSGRGWGEAAAAAVWRGRWRQRSSRAAQPVGAAGDACLVASWCFEPLKLCLCNEVT